jgi:hypothetical protein
MRTGRDDRARAEWFVRSGQWDSEPDWAVFEEEGMNCTMRRNGSGSWCGYVLVPDWHPLHGDTGLQHGDPIWFDVHGGVTWTGVMGWLPETGLTAGWSVGFDCAHSQDLSPKDYRYGFANGTYRTFEYAEEQTRGLAVQVSEHGRLEQLCRIVSGPNNGDEE